MLATDRRTRILERVAEDQTIRIGELAQEFGVSEMTIRRDIAKLERTGFLRRTYGGATAHLTRSLDPAFNTRSLQNPAAKAAHRHDRGLADRRRLHDLHRDGHDHRAVRASHAGS